MLGKTTRPIAPAMMAALTWLGIVIDPSHQVAVHSSAPEPLRAVLHLRIDDPNDPHRRNLRLDQPGALPLKAGDRFRIEVRLNRHAYLYLIWIGSDAKVAPIFPWRPGHWGVRPADQRKLDRLDLPAKADEAWEIPSGKPGLETLLLLVREESPLPQKDEETVARLPLGARGPAGVSIKEAVWLENGREIAIDDHDRALPRRNTRKSDDPILSIRRILQEHLRSRSDLYQAIVFPNEGGPR